MGRSFKFLLISQSSTNLGSSLYLMALIMVIFHATGSAFFSSIVTILNVIAKMLGGIISPILVERFKIKFLVIFSQLAQMIIFSLLALYVGLFAESINLLIVYLLVIANAIFEGFSRPSRNSILPRIVEQHHLVKANSLLSTTDQTLQLMGWSLGGILAVQIGAYNVLWFTIGLFALSALSIFLINLASSSSEPVGRQRKNRDAMKEGWMFLYKTPNLRTITVMNIVEGLGSSIWIGAVTLVFVQDVLHKGEEWWGFINSAYYFGTIMGGILILKFSQKVQKNLFRNMILGASSVAILTFLYSFNTIPLLSILLVVLMGPAYQLRDISQQTIVQRSVQIETLPKVLAAVSTIDQFVFGVSVLGIGLLVDMIGVDKVYIISAIMLGLATLYGGLMSRYNPQFSLKEGQST